jgi:hypothetical protein
MQHCLRRAIPALVSLTVLAACGQQPDSEPAGPAATPAAAEAAATEAAPVLERTAAPEGARVFFISPTDGATASSPLTVEFGIEGMTVVRAGDMTPASGHHHLIVDSDLPDLGQPIPADAQHIHFGDASTTTVLELEPGEHTLQLLLGDHRHVPHEPPVMSGRITVIIE